jgi:hypothetical protein
VHDAARFDSSLTQFIKAWRQVELKPAASTAERPRRRSSSTWGSLPAGEHQLELFYNLHVTPWFQLTGDLQIIRPNRPAADTAVMPQDNPKVRCHHFAALWG